MKDDDFEKLDAKMVPLGATVFNPPVFGDEPLHLHHAEAGVDDDLIDKYGTTDAHFGWSDSPLVRSWFAEKLESQGFDCQWKTEELELGSPWSKLGAQRERHTISVSVKFPARP